MRAFARNTRNIFLAVILTTFLTAAPSGTLNFIAKFDNAGNPTANSIISDNGTNIGIGTTNPTQRLTLGSGNILLPTARGGLDGNLYFGGITDVGQIGMRLFGGKINDQLQSGFIDVRSGTPTDGLIFRVDTFLGGAERMRITASGNVGINTPSPTGNLHIGGDRPDIFLVGNTTANQRGLRIHYSDPLRTGVLDIKGQSLRVRGESGTIGAGATDRLFIDLTNGNVGIGTTTNPTQKLDVAGPIRSSSGGFMFPDGTTQTTATLRGPQGPQGAQGPPGPPGPAVKTVAVCSPGGTGGCACNNRTVTRQFGRCTVTSETGSCFSGEANGCCAVCAP